MAQQNIGRLLARCARRKPLSATKIAEYTGATRVTVYNWFLGKGISPAFRPKVLKLIAKLSQGQVK